MNLEFNRIRFREEASKNLSSLKGKTGLTPNLLARIGFCMSLEDHTKPQFVENQPEGDKEIARPTLTGKWDSLFLALFLERCYADDIADAEHWPYFEAHMNRGVILLYKKVKRFSDLGTLLPKVHRSLLTAEKIEG